MAAWDASQSTLVARDVAKARIIEMAKEQGYTGAFKVFYNGTMVTDPSNLPDQVDLAQITVSEVLDQA